MISRPLKRVFTVLAAALGLAYLLPLVWVILTAFKTNNAVLKNPNSIFFRPSLETFQSVIGDGFGAILTSLQITVGVTVLVLVIGVPAAYALSRHADPVWNRVATIGLALLLILQMVPQPMTVIPLFSVLANWHVIGTLSGLILADLALLLPYAIIVLRPFVLAIPNVLYEAARIDGASSVQTFFRLTIPMLTNGIFTVGAIIFITAWGEFVYAINFLPEGTVLPVSGLLAQQNSQYSANWNSLMALAVLTALPLLVVFLFTQRRLINGLSLGAVK